jgi:hypothetical protein
VGRISTALRAQRSGFQDGFHDVEGDEIAFDTIEQVRDIVRRAYLGGGLGPTPVPTEPRPSDPLIAEAAAPETEPWGPTGGAHYEMALESLDPGALPEDYSDLHEPTKRRRLLEHLQKTSASERLYPYLRAFGEATMIELFFASRTTLHLPAQRQLLAGWRAMLVRLGLWENPSDFMDFLTRLNPPRWWWRRLMFGSVNVSVPQFSTAPSRLLFDIPCPLRRGWDRHIQSLAHKLLLPLVDRQYFQTNRDLPEFIPLLFASMVNVASGGTLVADTRAFRRSDRHRLVGHAFSWIAEQMPHVEQSHVVEQLLTEFAWKQLRRQPERPA